MPAAVTTPPMTIRFGEAPVRSTATARIAAIGGTLPALRAGKYADASVTPVPTTNAVTTVDVVTASPPAGRSRPKPLSNCFSPAATPMPAARPTIEATTPVIVASSMTERITCLRLAPIARSRAISF